MRKKQLFALLMAGALSVGMAPTATFAADTAAETSAEGELEGELDSADTEEPSEDPAETPAETTADPTEAPAAEETDEQAAEAGSAIVIGGDSFTSLEKAFAAVPDSCCQRDSVAASCAFSLPLYRTWNPIRQALTKSLFFILSPLRAFSSIPHPSATAVG